jgi:septum formation protein
MSKNWKIILGSQSPRRKQLMEGLEIPFTIKTLDTDESFDDSVPIREVAMHLAERKMEALITGAQDDEIYITADTTVILGDQILNKPVDEEDAIRMLNLLSGKMHEVITGVCMATKENQISFFDVTRVYFKTLSPETIEDYVKNHKPFDKAGAYGIQEKIGYVGIDHIEGCFYNVMGLPVRKVYENLGIMTNDNY